MISLKELWALFHWFEFTASWQQKYKQPWDIQFVGEMSKIWRKCFWSTRLAWNLIFCLVFVLIWQVSYLSYSNKLNFTNRQFEKKVAYLVLISLIKENENEKAGKRKSFFIKRLTLSTSSPLCNFLIRG